MPGSSGQESNLWLAYAMLTVACWGLYGILLHTGQTTMGVNDPNARYKAFLWVGIAYFLAAVLAPALLLLLKGSDWSMSGKGITWSLVAGVAGAIGAFGVLLAFGANGKPAVVMSIIFAGAPVVNAVVSLALHPPAAGFSSIKPQFFLGILLAAVGGMLVMLYKPGPSPKKSTASIERPAETEQR